MNKKFLAFDASSRRSNTREVVKNVFLALATGIFGYLSNFVVNAMNPRFFDSIFGTLLLALSVPVVIVLLYQQQRATPWSSLLIGFAVGIFQSFHFNWFQSHTDETMFKIALILLALMLILVPPVIRLINQQNIFGAGLLRSLVAASIGWAFWTGGFALFYDVIHAPFFEKTSATSPLFLAWFLGLLVKGMPFLIPIMTGSIITYCSGFSADNDEKSGWTCLVALFGCWFGLSWSFWKLDWFHLHLVAPTAATFQAYGNGWAPMYSAYQCDPDEKIRRTI